MAYPSGRLRRRPRPGDHHPLGRRLDGVPHDRDPEHRGLCRAADGRPHRVAPGPRGGPLAGVWSRATTAEGTCRSAERLARALRRGRPPRRDSGARPVTTPAGWCAPGCGRRRRTSSPVGPLSSSRPAPCAVSCRPDSRPRRALAARTSSSRFPEPSERTSIERPQSTELLKGSLRSGEPARRRESPRCRRRAAGSRRRISVRRSRSAAGSESRGLPAPRRHGCPRTSCG